MKRQESKGKGLGKGTSKDSGKQSTGKGAGKLPPNFVPSPSYDNGDMSIEERRELVVNQPFLDRSWELLRKSLISQSLSATNIAALEHTYAHWFAQLEHVPMNVPLEDVLGPLCEVELAAIMTDFEDYPPNEKNHRSR